MQPAPCGEADAEWAEGARIEQQARELMEA
jgi:hypothetical protein